MSDLETEQQGGSGGQRRTTVLAVILGALFFGGAHALIALTGGYFSLSGKELTILAGLVTGLGIALALGDRPWRRPGVRWPPRILLAGLMAAAGQALIVAAGSSLSMAIGVPGGLYNSQLAGLNWAWWQNLITRYPWWQSVAGVLDAALVGAVLCGGIAAGALLAERWLARWRDLLVRAR
jgi:hypothetical protein